MLGLTTPDLVILALYFLVVAAIGVISTRLVRNREDFLLGGRKFGKLLMAFFAFGAGTHADNAVGVAAQSYKVGFAGIWYQWVMLFTLPIYWLIAPVFRRARVLTTADVFERRYGSQFMQLYAWFAMFICVSFTSVMLYGSARLVEALTAGALPWQWGIVTMSVVAFGYGIAGGLIAAVWNDFLQGVLTIVMSLLIIPFFWARIGGLAGFQAALPDPQETFRMVLSKEMTLYWIIMQSINSLLSMVVQPHIMSNTAAAKSELDSRVGFVGGMILKRLITVPWALTGVMAIALFGAGKIESDHAFGAMARELLPSGFTGLMLACVMASMMDNCAVLMLSAAGIYANNVHRRLKPDLSEAALVTVSRLAAVVFAVVSIALSYAFTDVPAAMRFLWKTVPLMGIPFFLGLFWRRGNRWGAFAGFAVALAAMLVGEYVFEWKGDAGLPKIITLNLSTGFLSGILVSLLTAPEPRRALDRFFLLLRTPLGQEAILREAGLVELPGTGTFDAPVEEPAPEAALPSAEPDMKQASRQGIVGFAVVTVIMLAMLGSVKLMAVWMAGG